MISGSRIALGAVGAVFGALLLGPTNQVAGALLGGLIVLGALELQSLRLQLKSLREEVGRLRRDAPTCQEPAPPPKDPPTETPPWREFEPARPSAPPLPASSPAQSPLTVSLPPESPQRISEPSYDPASNELAPIRWVREFLLGGNAVVRIGSLILFFGVAFLLRYLAEHTRVPIEWRLAGIMLGGVALLVVGWRLRVSRTGYALALQGAGVGVLYLTVFAALRLYALLPGAIAFPLLAAVATLLGVLAVLQNSLSLAILGVVGGFLAPVLASTGQGSHVALFSYYALLNAGILGVAWFKAWRPLNIVGFVFTFGIATVWGVLRYRPELFASTEPFLVLYFLFYLAIAVLFTWRQPVQLTGYVDGTLVFVTPIAVFALQSALLGSRLLPLAYSALVMSAVYLGLAWALKRRRAEQQAMLVEAFLAIGVVLVTLAVPLALNANWNVAAWSLEGAALTWIGCRQGRVLARSMGILLLLACGLVAAAQFDLSPAHTGLALVDYAGIVLLSVAALLGACTLHRHRSQLLPFEQPISTVLFCWGLWWWSAGSVSEIAQYWPTQALAGTLLLLTLTTLLCERTYRFADIPVARIAALLQLPLMIAAAVFALGSLAHPGAAAGYLAWPLAFIGLYYLMAQLEGVARGPLANGLNAGATWLFLALGSWEAAFQINRAVAGSDVWPTTAWVVLPLVFLALLPQSLARISWPFGKNRDVYLFPIAMGVAIFLVGWSLLANLGSDGNFAPLPYCPLFNPLDLTQALVLLVLWRHWRTVRAVSSSGFPRIDARLPVPTLAALAFLWLNAMLLRTLHQWFGVSFAWDSLMESTLVQTSLSIFWTLLAFVIMVSAARLRRRIPWLVGATLLGVVIAKLFLVDLSSVGSIERIVSFLGVGLMMLVLGYLAPLPPAKGEI